MLINCPECGREDISDSAVACPNCGYGVKEHFNMKRFVKEEKPIKTHLKKMLKAKDIQEILGYSTGKSYAIISAKGFPTIRIGKNYYIKEEDFEKWIKNNIGKEVIL